MNRIILILLFLLPSIVLSQVGIDTVYSFAPGAGQNAGQDIEYYPNNIFGYPYRLANLNVPTNDPYDILSLGLGGEIVVGFKNQKIENIEGPDFIIYENVFINPATKKLFVEPAIVSVSQDGVHFISFPFDSATLEGCAGISPTLGNDRDYNPNEYGGDAFDIEQLGLSMIKYIKISDITSMLIDDPKHEFYDPILSGFDLDALVGLNVVTDATGIDNGAEKPYSITYLQSSILITVESELKYIIYDLLGNVLDSATIFNQKDVLFKSSGVYFLLIDSNRKTYSEKIIVR